MEIGDGEMDEQKMRDEGGKRDLDMDWRILTAVDVRESIGNDIISTVRVNPLKIRGGWNGVVFSLGKGPVAPLLSVDAPKSKGPSSMKIGLTYNPLAGL